MPHHRTALGKEEERVYGNPSIGKLKTGGKVRKRWIRGRSEQQGYWKFKAKTFKKYRRAIFKQQFRTKGFWTVILCCSALWFGYGVWLLSEAVFDFCGIAASLLTNLVWSECGRKFFFVFGRMFFVGGGKVRDWES